MTPKGWSEEEEGHFTLIVGDRWDGKQLIVIMQSSGTLAEGWECRPFVRAGSPQSCMLRGATRKWMLVVIRWTSESSLKYVLEVIEVYLNRWTNILVCLYKWLVYFNVCVVY